MLNITVTTFTNGYGDWRARVTFSHTLSENDPRPAFNLDAQWSRIRRAARRAIVREIAEREQRAREATSDVIARVNASLPRLSVIEQHAHGTGAWYGVTIGEYHERNAADWQ